MMKMKLHTIFPPKYAHILPWVLAGLCILAGLQHLHAYLLFDLNLVLALMAAPCVIRVQQPRVYSHRYALLAVAAFLLFAFIHMQVFFLLGLGATVFYVVESQRGKMNILPLLLLVLLSPVPAYLAEVFTFPLRLWMSGQTAQLLGHLGLEVVQQGNVFEVTGDVFSVDQACIGLQSMVTGLILTTLLIAFGAQRTRRSLPLAITATLYALTLVLLLLANFIRMTGLVLFRSLPETFSHEFIGMMGLILYVLLPMYGAIHFSLKKWGKPAEQAPVLPRFHPGAAVVALLLTGAVAYFNLHRFDYRNEPQDASFAAIDLPGFNKTLLNNHIAKLEQDSVLIYLKPPAHFWGADHSPDICWRASGYRLTRIRPHSLGHQTIYIAQLEKGDDVLHTAWWYDNGAGQTHSQWQWRLQRIRGAPPFRLVNVTVAQREALLPSCREALPGGAWWQAMWQKNPHLASPK